MRRLLASLAGAAGGLAAWRLLTRRRGSAVEAPPEPDAEADPRAEELRAKLAETRDGEPEAELASEVEAEPAPEAPADPEERRRAVHERGRAALDEMQPGE